MNRGEKTLFLSKSEWFGVFTGLGAVLVSAAAWAAGGEEHVDTRAQLIDFGWRIANFLVLLAILYKLMWKKMKTFFAGRREGIKASLGRPKWSRPRPRRSSGNTTTSSSWPRRRSRTSPP